MSFRRLLGLILPPKDRVEEAAAIRKKVNHDLDELEATLDGEDQWFLRTYEERHKEAPACGIRQKHKTT